MSIRLIWLSCCRRHSMPCVLPALKLCLRSAATAATHSRPECSDITIPTNIFGEGGKLESKKGGAQREKSLSIAHKIRSSKNLFALFWWVQSQGKKQRPVLLRGGCNRHTCHRRRGRVISQYNIPGNCRQLLVRFVISNNYLLEIYFPNNNYQCKKW